MSTLYQHWRHCGVKLVSSLVSVCSSQGKLVGTRKSCFVLIFHLPNLLKGPTKFALVLVQKEAANRGLNMCFPEGHANNINLTRTVGPWVLRRTCREMLWGEGGEEWAAWARSGLPLNKQRVEEEWGEIWEGVGGGLSDGRVQRWMGEAAVGVTNGPRAREWLWDEWERKDVRMRERTDRGDAELRGAPGGQDQRGRER